MIATAKIDDFLRRLDHGLRLLLAHRLRCLRIIRCRESADRTGRDLLLRLIRNLTHLQHAQRFLIRRDLAINADPVDRRVRNIEHGFGTPAIHMKVKGPLSGHLGNAMCQGLPRRWQRFARSRHSLINGD